MTLTEKVEARCVRGGEMSDNGNGVNSDGIAVKLSAEEVVAELTARACKSDMALWSALLEGWCSSRSGVDGGFPACLETASLFTADIRAFWNEPDGALQNADVEEKRRE